MVPRKILAIKLRALGDTVLMTAPLFELRRAYPSAEIHVAVVSQWAPILENHPAVDRVWNYERHTDRAARARSAARLAMRLREQKYDCVVNFHASPSTSMITRATGAAVRSIHFHGHKSASRYSTVTIPGKGVLKPIIERDMDTIRALGLSVPEGKLPKVFLHASEVAQAQSTLDRLFPPTPGVAGPILAVSLGASRPSKCWFLERFVALALGWAQQEGGRVLVLASQQEARTAHRFMKCFDEILTASVQVAAERNTIRKKVTSSTKQSVRQLAALLSRVSVFVGNDSGPKHLAVAVGTPTVTLFGPEHPFEWHPYPKDAHPYFFVENLSCRNDALPGMPAWCAVHECTQEQHKCMRMIAVDTVLAECRRIVKHP